MKKKDHNRLQTLVFNILKENTNSSKGMTIRDLLNKVQQAEGYGFGHIGRLHVNDAVESLQREGYVNIYREEGLNHWYFGSSKKRAEDQDDYSKMYVYQTDVVSDLIEIAMEYVGEAEHIGKVANMHELSIDTVENIEEWKKKRKKLLEKDFRAHLSGED